MMQQSFASTGPWALRWPRGTTPDEIGSPASLRPAMEPGTAELLRAGDQGAVFALGSMVEIALDAAAQLQANTGIEIEVYDARFCKPLDREAMLGAAARFGWIATVEEHAAAGGFGSAVAELLADASATQPRAANCRFLRHAVPDHFIEHMTSRDEQLEECGLDAASLAQAWADSLQTSKQEVPSS
jgi:1-deoxy-D-xylulose-5-phosphate synthase